MVRKIAIIGPESTGKSTLCEQLAQHYHTLWCPEYAREYLLAHGMKYTYDDLFIIAQGQVALEQKYIQLVESRQFTVSSPQSAPDSYRDHSSDHNSLLFIDTNMYVMKVWCDFVFGKCHQYILDQIGERKYDLYLLCNIDLPWTHDELREYPDFERRQQLYMMYKDLMINQPVPWIEIRGGTVERFRAAVDAVDRLL